MTFFGKPVATFPDHAPAKKNMAFRTQKAHRWALFAFGRTQGCPCEAAGRRFATKLAKMRESGSILIESADARANAER
jgi:hypothetical protein